MSSRSKRSSKAPVLYESPAIRATLTGAPGVLAAKLEITTKGLSARQAEDFARSVRCFARALGDLYARA